MTIEAIVDPGAGLQTWRYSGRLTLSDFDDLETQLRAVQSDARRCPRLLIEYHRGTDVSEMDAQTLEKLLLRVKAIHAGVLDTCIQFTAHACSDDIVRHAVEHYVLRVRDRADDTHGIFVTRDEALAWLESSELRLA